MGAPNQNFLFEIEMEPRFQLEKTAGHVSVCNILEKSFEVAVLETKFNTYSLSQSIISKQALISRV